MRHALSLMKIPLEICLGVDITEYILYNTLRAVNETTDNCYLYSHVTKRAKRRHKEEKMKEHRKQRDILHTLTQCDVYGRVPVLCSIKYEQRLCQ